MFFEFLDVFAGSGSACTTLCYLSMCSPNGKLTAELRAFSIACANLRNRTDDPTVIKMLETAPITKIKWHGIIKLKRALPTVNWSLYKTDSLYSFFRDNAKAVTNVCLYDDFRPSYIQHTHKHHTQPHHH